MNEPVVPEVDELIASLRPRLADTVGDAHVDRLVREALADLGAVRVTTSRSSNGESVTAARRRRPSPRSSPPSPPSPPSTTSTYGRTARHGLSRDIAASAVSSNAAGLSVPPVSIAT